MINSKLFLSCATLCAGGAERVISVLSTPFADHYKDVRILLWLDQPVFYEIDDRISIINIEKESGSDSLLAKMKWFREYIVKERPDLILSFLYPWSMKLLFSLLYVDCNVVVAERLDPTKIKGGGVVKTLRNLLYRKAQGILVQTDYNRIAFKGTLYNKTHRIFNPNNISVEYVGKSLTTPKRDVIVSVGRLDKQKNYPLLIKAFKVITNIHPQYDLHIYGEGNERKKIESLIKNLGLGNKVHLEGVVSNIAEHIMDASLFVMSSDYEGMPNALIEAMSIGLPCISTKVSGAVDFIRDGYNGLLTEVGDDVQLVNAIHSLLSDASYANRLASKAIDVYTLTDPQSIIFQWLEYIDSIILESK